MRRVVLVVCFILFLLISVTTVQAQAVYYVSSENGNDSSPGTYAQPFRTIQKAQVKIREAISSGQQGGVAYLRQGVYQLTSPLIFTSQDNGISTSPVVYQSYNGEPVSITSLKPIRNWVSEGNNIWSSTIPEVQNNTWWFRALFINNQRATRARFPNTNTYMTLTSVSSDYRSLTFNQTIPGTTTQTANTEVVVLTDWDVSRIPINSMSGSGVQAKARVGVMAGANPHPYLSARAGRSGYVEHAKSLIDVAYEWFLEKETGKLFLKVNSGENPNSMTITAPTLDKLLTIQGTQTNKVKNLRFSDMTFEGTNWEYPSYGFPGNQGGYYGPTEVGMPQPLMPTSITLTHASDIAFTSNRFQHFENSGIGIGEGTKNITISSNGFRDIGGVCIHPGYNPLVALSGEWALATRQNGDVPESITITNNYLTQCGAVFYGGTAIFSSFVKNLTLSKNYIYDLPYSGIAVTSQWWAGRTSQENAHIVQNTIRDVMKLLADGGGIYTTGESPNSEMTGNVIFNVLRSPVAVGSSNNGIFFDQATKGYTVQNTITYNTSGGALRFNLSSESDQIFQNNYFDTSPPGPVTIVNAAKPTIPECTGFNYSTWSVCSNGFQTRLITSRTPSNCIGGLPTTWQNCSVSPTTIPTGVPSSTPVPTQVNLSCTNTYSSSFGPAILTNGQTVESPVCGTLGCTPDKRLRIFCNAGTLVTACRNQFDSPNPATACPIPTVTGTLGDANGDGSVNGIDYIIWLQHYNTTVTQGPSVGDFDNSGMVNGVDYIIWLNHYSG